MSINEISINLDKVLSAAGLDPQSGRMASVTELIRKTLNAAGLAQSGASAPPHAASRTPARAASPIARRADRGSFETFTCSNGKAQRDYKLFVPASYDGKPMPLIVMLHGCKQNPDDFARGTRMNQLAEERGFLVVYPAQAARANGSNCWNWFSPSDQQRNGEEPVLLAGIVRQTARSHAVDESRVFAAGLSAGAAMASILAATYPEVFKAIAVHSGLPAGAAHDVGSAFAAMHGHAESPSTANVRPVPTLVFHGDSDATVVASNGRLVEAKAVDAFDQDAREPLYKEPVATKTCGGRACAVTRYTDQRGNVKVESWMVAGAGHAWFGGSSAGSFTDAAGPDASREIVRFFLG